MKILLENLTKRYDATEAVSQLNMTIENGALHFILGPSGCGKTTTLRMLAGLEKPTCGKIYFDATDVTELSPSERGIGMVFQNYALWPHMTIEENITYGLKLKKLTKKEIQVRAHKYLEMMHLEKLASRYPSQLSGGQQQRVALARALAIEPKVLLLDEPLSNLDAKLRHEMRENLRTLHAELKITTVYVTHDQSESLSMGTNISIMKDGKHIQSGSPKDIYNHPKNSFIAKFIGETNLIEGKVTKTTEKLHFVKTSFGIFEADSRGESFKENEAVTLSLRPELFKVYSSKNQEKVEKETNQFSTHLKEKIYLGESEQWKLENDGNELIAKVLLRCEEQSLPRGSELSFSIKPEHITLLRT